MSKDICPERLKTYIEKNYDLLEENIEVFVLECPDSYIRLLLSILDSAGIDYPESTLQIVKISTAHEDYYDPFVIEEILENNGASEELSAPPYYMFTGMSASQIANAFSEIKLMFQQKYDQGEYLSENIVDDFDIK